MACHKFKRYCAETKLIRKYYTKNTKEHHSVKTESRTMVLLCLIVQCICTNFHKNILNGFRNVDRHEILSSKCDLNLCWTLLKYNFYTLSQ